MNTIDVWANTFLAAMTTIWTEVAGLLPNLLAALLLILVGYLVAKGLHKVSRKLLQVSGINQLSEKTGISTGLSRLGLNIDLSDVVALFVFWLIMLIFLISAAEIVGLTRMASIIDDFILYLPKILGALLILLVGLFLAGFARSLVSSSAEGIGIEYSGALGSIVYGLIAVLVFSLAAGQLDLEVAILNQVITVILVSLGLASAIAFGFGAREIAANVMASTYLRELYDEDDHLEIGSVKGKVVFIGSIKTVVKTDSGEVSLPNITLVNSDVTRVND